MPSGPSHFKRSQLPEVEMDDIDAYMATLTEDEREEVAAASAAIDIAILLYRARERRGLSQTAAAKLAGLQQQAVSRLERPDANPRLGTIQSYLAALGYAVELKAIDPETGETAVDVVLPPILLRSGPRRAKEHPSRRSSGRAFDSRTEQE